MPYPYPRKLSELAAAGRIVSLECEACRRKGPADLSLLQLTFGEDFDIYASMREMRDRLSCPGCGAPRPLIEVFDLSRQPFVEVSFDQSVANQLEFNAQQRARAAS